MLRAKLRADYCLQCDSGLMWILTDWFLLIFFRIMIELFWGVFVVNCHLELWGLSFWTMSLL